MVRRISVFILIFSQLVLLAKEPPKAPTHNRYVQDYASVLSAQQERYLLYKLDTFYKSTSNEICIVTEKSTDGDDIVDYAFRLAQAWGIGSEGNDNGVLIYIAINDREIDIEVGKGLEGAIADIDAKRIIDRIMVPKFREGEYGGGINEAVDAIIGLSFGEYTFKERKTGKGIPMWVIILIVIVLIIIFSNKGNNGKTYSGRRRTIWVGGGGFGSGGSFGGGGFGGGFGGGSFGGGGASGSW